ncbi:hypothetical protein GCM10027277_01060 [Pseudoduganella ginsengisoli]|uniref:Uncharacterized protein n=1 Tax=Pseudoduganella ginsengisoli TaxID=1462440 RepID=A0A6L6QAU5_9BURK|nr:hypothetical protein [Pseudoduganella ginsengisoli]MTW06342.1 hypothetical protein [Pseudoduganella ginsengisoli]
MRLPGTRYQEHGWEHVRKLLGRCSLAVFGALPVEALLDAARRPEVLNEVLDDYLDAMAVQLRDPRYHAQAALPGNSYGETAGELACSLLFELRAQPSMWDSLCAAVAAEHAKQGAFWQHGGGSAMLRKKANDMYAVLRDKADADACTAATGRPCSPNRIYTYRMLDMAYSEIARIFANWRHCEAQVADILGRAPRGMPIEARQMQTIADCRAAWVIRWSETLERHTGNPGPLHTKSKRFASLKNQPETIAAMLEEIGEYEALSANRDALGQVRSDEEEAALWLEDYWRVVAQSEAAEAAGAVDSGGELPEPPEPDLLDCLLAPPGHHFQHDDDSDDDEPVMEAAAIQDDDVSLSPGFVGEAALHGAGQVAAILAGVSLPVRLAVYHALLGPRDDSYPDAWLDAATGELPSLRQLAALDGISMPTLRKRRNEAMAQLAQAAADGVTGKGRDE